MRRAPGSAEPAPTSSSGGMVKRMSRDGKRVPVPAGPTIRAAARDTAADSLPDRPTVRTPLPSMPSMGSSFAGDRLSSDDDQLAAVSLGSRGSSRALLSRGGSKKEVSWGAPRFQVANALSRPGSGVSQPRSPLSRAAFDAAQPRSRTPKSAASSQQLAELETQLNLLRERSWSEQQSLRRQLDDAKKEAEDARKAIEEAHIQAQQLQNEITVLQEREQTAAQLSGGGDVLKLIDEKNAQIRQLESLVQDLASQSMPKMPGALPSRGAGPAGSGGGREAALEAEVARLVGQRDKEQEDLRELEQVVEQFEAKMGSLRRENRELRRANGELRQRVAEHEEQTHTRAGGRAAAPESASTCVAARAMPGAERGEVAEATLPEGHSDREVVLEQKLRRLQERLEAAEGRASGERASAANLLDAERAQSGLMAQRLMGAEEALGRAQQELGPLKGRVATLERELDFAKRRTAEAEMAGAGTEFGQEEAIERLRAVQRERLDLEEDAMSLRALLSNTRARIVGLRAPALALVARAAALRTAAPTFRAWALHTAMQLRVGYTAARWGQRQRARALEAVAFHAMREATTLCSRAEVQEAATREGNARDARAREEAARAIEDAERGQATLRAELKAAAERADAAERAADTAGQGARALAAAQNEVARLRAADSSRETLTRRVVEESRAALAECARLAAAVAGLATDNDSLRAERAQLHEERGAWLEEQQRVAQRQAAGAMTASEAGGQVLRERCAVLAAELALAQRELARAASAREGVVRLRSALESLVRHVYMRRPGVPLPVLPGGGTGTLPAAAEADSAEACVEAVEQLRRECEALLQAVATERSSAQGRDPAAADLALLGQRAAAAEQAAARAQIEARAARAALEREAETREDDAAAHAAQLAMAHKEAAFLQEVADGAEPRAAFHAALQHAEVVVLQVVGRLGQKSAECAALQREVQRLARGALSAAQDAERRDMGVPAMRTAAAADADGSRGESGLDHAGALAVEVREVKALWRSATSELFQLQSAALGHAGALREARAAREAAEARAEEEGSARALLAQQRAGLDAQLEQTHRALAAERERAEEAAREAAEATRRRRDAETARDEGAVRLTVAAQRTAELEERRQTDAFGARTDVQTARTFAARLQQRLATAERVAAQCRTEALDCATAAGVLADSLAAEAADHRRAAAESRAGAQRAALALHAAEQARAEAERQLTGARAEWQAASAGSSGLEGQLRDARREAGELKEAMREREAADREREEADREREEAGRRHEEELAVLRARVTEVERALEVRAAQARQEGDALGARVSAAEAEAERARGERDEARNECAEARRLTVTAEGAVAAAERRLAAAQEDLVAARARAEALAAQLAEAEAEAQRAQAAQLQGGREAAAARDDAARSALRAEEEARGAVLAREAAEGEACSARAEAEQARAAGAVAETRAAAAQEEARAAEGRLSALRGEVEGLEDAAREAGARARALESKIGEQEVELVRVRAELAAAEQRAAEARQGHSQRAAAAGEELRDAQARVEGEVKERTRLEGERKYLQERVKALKQAAEDARADAERREAALEGVQGSAAVLEMQLEEARAALQGRDGAVALLEAGWEEATRRLREQEEEMADKDAALQRARERAAELEQAAAAAAEAQAAAQAELHGAQAQLAVRLRAAEGEVRRVLEELAGSDAEVEMLVDLSHAGAAALKGEADARGSAEAGQAALAARLKDLEEEAGRQEQSAIEAQSALREQVRMGKERLGEAIAALEKMHAERERARLEALQAAGLCEELAAQVAEKEREGEAAQAEGEAARAEGERLRGQVTAKEQEVSELEAAVERETDRRDEASAQAARVREQLSEAVEEVDRKAAEVGLHAAAIERLREELGGREARVREEQERAAALEAEMNAQEREARAAAERWEQARREEAGVRTRLEADLAAARHRLGGSRAQAESLLARCAELEEENVLASAKLAEYDGILQSKGRELARLHGSLAEAQALAGESQERITVMQTLQEKLQRDVAARDRQLKMYQTTSGAHSPGDPEQRHATLRRAAEEAAEEAAEVREQLVRLGTQLAAAEKDRKQRAAEAEAASEEAGSLRRAAAAREAEVDGLSAKVAALEEALAEARAREDDGRSKASTTAAPAAGGAARPGSSHPSVSPPPPHAASTSGSPAAARAAEVEAAALAREVAMLRERLDTRERQRSKGAGEVAGALERRAQAAEARQRRRRIAAAFRGLVEEVGDAEARARALQQLAALCRRARALQAREQACDARFGEDFETAVSRVRAEVAQEAQADKIALQQQLVDKTDALLMAEKKFAQLLAWVQKGQRGAAANPAGAAAH